MGSAASRAQAKTLAAGKENGYFIGMDTLNLDTGRSAHLETEAERRNRFAWEADKIAEARDDVAAGRLVASAKVKAWIDSIGTDDELPVPYSGR